MSFLVRLEVCTTILVRKLEKGIDSGTRFPHKMARTSGPSRDYRRLLMDTTIQRSLEWKARVIDRTRVRPLGLHFHVDFLFCRPHCLSLLSVTRSNIDQAVAVEKNAAISPLLSIPHNFGGPLL